MALSTERLLSQLLFPPVLSLFHPPVETTRAMRLSCNATMSAGRKERRGVFALEDGGARDDHRVARQLYLGRCSAGIFPLLWVWLSGLVAIDAFGFGGCENGVGLAAIVEAIEVLRFLDGLDATAAIPRICCECTWEKSLVGSR